MKVILRKEDSSTSSLLFIYNMVYSRVQKESFHLSSLLEIMSRFGKAETATRMALSRACKTGILETSKFDKDVVYSLTPIALQFIKSWNVDAQSCWKRLALRNTPWEDKWHIVNIALNDAMKKGNLSEKLQQIGYVQIDVQTWLSPYHQTEAFNSILSELNVEANTKSVYGEFESSIDIDSFVEKTFELSLLREQYTEFSSAYQALMDRLSEDPSAITEGKALPILNKLGFAYFAIAIGDPMLPRMLLPQWQGDQAAALMHDLRKILENAAWDYLKDFN
jgi:phenylacetic acid degradation operon negative regulatory protein